MAFVVAAAVAGRVVGHGPGRGETFTPEKVYVRGLSTYGCPTGEKLPKDEYERITEGWVGKLHMDLRSNVTPEKPFALNHQL